MTPQEIPHDQWQPYLDQFSRAHREQPACLETKAGNAQAGENARGLPLVGITDDCAPGEPEQIHVMLARKADEHLDHLIEHPVRVCAVEWNDGYSGCIEIESADGTCTTVQVGPPGKTLPEGIITDGVIA